MKKSKKFFAIAAVLAVFVSFGSTAAVAAEAACPPHGPYEDYLMDIEAFREEHFVPYKTSDGQYLYDSHGKLITVKCEVTWNCYRRGIYCKTCGWLTRDYWYNGREYHTICK